MTRPRPDTLSLRLSPELREQLESAAKRAGRSLNGEIRMRLEMSLNGEVPDFTLGERVAGLESDMATIKKKLGID